MLTEEEQARVLALVDKVHDKLLRLRRIENAAKAFVLAWLADDDSEISVVVTEAIGALHEAIEEGRLMLTEDLLIPALDRERQRFDAACLQDEPKEAHAAYHAWLELVTEQQNNMREELKKLSRRLRLRREGR